MVVMMMMMMMMMMMIKIIMVMVTLFFCCANCSESLVILASCTALGIILIGNLSCTQASRGKRI